MPSFEESLLDFKEAERIRVEHTLERFSTHQLAFKHALPYKTIQDILHYRIHAKPGAAAERSIESTELDA